MKTFKIIVAALLFTLIALPQQLFGAIIAGPIINPANGHSYYLLTGNTWTESQAEAVRLGGTLAIINDAAEQAWVFGSFSTNGCISRNLWIGLRETAIEGVYAWVDGSPLTYTNWASGEPNNNVPGESYVHMSPSRPGAWNDLPDAGIPNSTFSPVYGLVEVRTPRLNIEVASVAISWLSETNRQYQLEFSTLLAPTIWTNFGGPVQGNGTTNIVFDTILGQPRRFYRIIRLP
jgi:hypothetical protein